LQATGHIAHKYRIRGFISSEGNVDRALMEKSIELLDKVLSWVGSREDDQWAKLVSIVEKELPGSAYVV